MDQWGKLGKPLSDTGRMLISLRVPIIPFLSICGVVVLKYLATNVSPFGIFRLLVRAKARRGRIVKRTAQDIGIQSFQRANTINKYE